MLTSPASSHPADTSPSSSPAAGPAKRSVRDLLAELSDSDEEVSRPVARRIVEPAKSVSETGTEDGAESSDDEVVLGGGRLAARLAGKKDAITASKPNIFVLAGVDSEDELGKSSLYAEDNTANGEEDGAVSKPKRKLLLKRKRVIEDDEGRDLSPHHRSVPRDLSPSPIRSSSPPQSGQDSPPLTPAAADHRTAGGKSKFQALVEKARKERLVREAAEEAKKAAREAQQSTSSSNPRRQRGSSPADDSEEDSDTSETAPAKRLTKDARPTRKASRKALDEMHRETQRMNRSMQLAHQARTKKKFTKESFFAAFNHMQGPTPSSAPSSDAENAKLHSTPPTSPLLEPELNKETSAIPHTISKGLDLDDEDDVPDLMAIVAANRAEPTAKEQVTTPVVSDVQLTVMNGGMMPTKLQHDLDSDSDIEVVFDNASKRKYAAFENLPKSKARETQSHLALRSLAHVRNQKDKKSTMNIADMGPALLRAARLQALEERKAKIEKLRAAGVVIQTTEEREQEEEELEDLVDKARQEDEEIRKREQELAKKEGTYTRDALDDEDSDDDDDDDFQGDEEADSGSEDENNVAEDGESEDAERDDDDENVEHEDVANVLLHEVAEESKDDAAEQADDELDHAQQQDLTTITPMPCRTARKSKLVIEDDDDEDESMNQQEVAESPALPSSRKTPFSVMRSARKVIPGLEHSDNLPLGLTQAFAATMADSQSQGELATQDEDSMDILRDLPSPNICMMPRLNRLESLDVISESVPGSQTQLMGLEFELSQSQRIPESPAMLPPTQAPFDLTQDAGYSFSPFAGNRFAETPSKQPYSTEDTLILSRPEDSPIMQRKGRLQRGRQASEEVDDEAVPSAKSAFQIMEKAAKRKTQEDFSKKKSEARQAVDEAAEESDDEYAGLGGASDDDSGDDENEEDRQMIDEDTQVGKGDEAKLAKLYADRERESDEAAVSKLLKDITTGGLRRKRGVGNDLDLSDEEDAAARRREAKRREFAKMRRELLKDEAVGKIADDQRKQAFIKSIEDREVEEEDDDDFDRPEIPLDVDSQEQSQLARSQRDDSQGLRPSRDSQLNIGAQNRQRMKAAASRKPGTLAEIRDSVSFLVEEPDSQAGLVDLGLSDSDDEPEAYVDLDRHFQQAEADEDEENEDLGDFIVDDEDKFTSLNATFKKPDLPIKGRDGDRAPFTDRRTKNVAVVDRLSLLRQASSSSVGSNASNKMAFYTGKPVNGTLNNAPSLLRRATTNSSLGPISGRENVSATGVVTNKTERGSAAQEKEFVRKVANTARNAINYQGRQNLKEEKMSARAGVVKRQQGRKKGDGFLSGLFRGDTWG